MSTKSCWQKIITN